jgi:hypothetical protein
MWGLAVAAAVAACHGGDDSATPSRADNRAAAGIANAIAANSLAATAEGLPVPLQHAHALDYEIPTSFVGRWGLTLGDCNPDNMADKGLLTIKPDKLVFYESKGSIGAISRHSPYDITLRLDMTGEGQSWTNVMHLVLDAASTRLERTEVSAPNTVYRYKRC